MGWQVYADYGGYIGWVTCALILASLLLGQAAYIGSEYWLATWAYRSAPQSFHLCCNCTDMVAFYSGMLQTMTSARIYGLVACQQFVQGIYGILRGTALGFHMCKPAILVHALAWIWHRSAPHMNFGFLGTWVQASSRSNRSKMALCLRDPSGRRHSHLAHPCSGIL